MAVVGLGMDLCSVARIREILSGPRAERFKRRVYTPSELQQCGARAEPAAAFAARFAAKEALVKAMGAPKGIRWLDMEVVRDEGCPRFRLSGMARRELERRGATALLTMTHDAGVAAATVVLETAPEGEEP
jgi:holo-[acyl-carrier protein] synthase